MYHDTFPIATKLKALTFDWTGHHVVDLGCNSGMLGPYVRERGAVSYVGWEANADWAAEGRRRHPGLTIRTGDVLEADLTGATVLCALGLFHHLRDETIATLFDRAPDVMLCEQPMGVGPFRGYYIRTEDWYREALHAHGFAHVERVPYGFTYPIDRAILVARRHAG